MGRDRTYATCCSAAFWEASASQQCVHVQIETAVLNGADRYVNFTSLHQLIVHFAYMSRGGHYHRSRVAICDRDQDVLIRKNGFDRLILLTNAA